VTWLDALRHLNPEQIAVVHDPMTPRYQRAGVRLGYLLVHGVFLGHRGHDDLAEDQCVEVAVWAAAPSGVGDGYYACFRLFLDEYGAVEFAVLFAFYDGRDASPGFATAELARTYSLTQGFHDEDQD